MGTRWGIAALVALVAALAAAAPASAAPSNLTSNPSGTGNSTSVTWSWDGSDLAYECYFLPTGTAPGPTDWQTCSSGQSFAVPAPGTDGAYDFGVRVALDVVDPPLTGTYTLDTAPAVVTITPPQSPGNNRAPTWALGTSENATLQCELDGPGGAGSPTDCSGGTFTPPSPLSADGVYELHVTATDDAGNPSTAAPADYTLDTQPPAAPVITGGPAGTISQPDAAFAFSAEAGATTRCELLRDGGVVYAWSTCTSPWTYGLTTQPDGNYTFLVSARDPAGNTGSAGTRSFTLTRPVAPLSTTPGRVLRPGVCINLFNGTPRADAITGSPLGDVLDGMAGNDRLSGGAGDDCILGDSGNDRLDGGPGNDDVRGLSGRDLVRGGSGSDSLSGGKGRDTISGGPGNDTIDAADGARDTVKCGSGRDVVFADRTDRLRGCETKHFKGRKSGH